jgi:hypothetical protein
MLSNQTVRCRKAAECVSVTVAISPLFNLTTYLIAKFWSFSGTTWGYLFTSVSHSENLVLFAWAECLAVKDKHIALLVVSVDDLSVQPLSWRRNVHCTFHDKLSFSSRKTVHKAEIPQYYLTM